MPKYLPALALALLAAGATAAAANLSVTFVQPENYTDAAYSGSRSDEKGRLAVQKELEQHLQKLADKKLPPDAQLDIEVLDIDLAGRVDPLQFRTGSEVRVVRSVDWPRITLRYTLREGGKVVQQKEEKVSDMNFQASANRYTDSDRLRYEKAMLDDWFSKRFAKP